MSLFEQILQTNLINFIIVVSTLVLIFKKAKLDLLIEKMALDVKEKVEKSSKNAQSALSEYKTTKKSLKDIPLQQEEIISLAKNNSQNIKEKTEYKTQLHCNELKNGLERTFSSQKENFKNLTIDEVYQSSIDLAQKETLKRLDFDTQKKLIDLSINELDKIEGSII